MDIYIPTVSLLVWLKKVTFWKMSRHFLRSTVAKIKSGFTSYATSCCWKTSVYFPRPSLLNSSGRSEPFRDEFRLQPLLPVTEEMQSM